MHATPQISSSSSRPCALPCPTSTPHTYTLCVPHPEDQLQQLQALRLERRLVALDELKEVFNRHGCVVLVVGLDDHEAHAKELDRVRAQHFALGASQEKLEDLGVKTVARGDS
eukprot:353596-Chlamydomonas_euryale.AAC.1